MEFSVKTAIKPGANAIVQRMVTQEDAAANYGSKQLGNLIASPIYLEMMLEATTDMVDHLLPDYMVSVGTSTQMTHLAPSCLGMYLSVKAILTDVIDNKLLFDIEFRDDAGLTGTGKHTRLVVRKDKLLQKATERLNKIPQNVVQ